ncbi:MetQ/NlpA family ABC transporter substrate-binding protein [Orbus sturtevantii]|uniref:MetQ/NlpA family ABC transporter substrate-binding protein n=1 Tax=Orbus sturtevantii TaxID=3074109 RepID=UPI00370D9DFF
MNKYIYLPLLFLFSLFLIACDQKSDSNTVQGAKQEIRIGMTPSMHNILMENIVKPRLEELGYRVTLVNFSSLRDSDTALAEGSIDLNAAQHQAYLDTYKRETHNDDLVSLVHIPSISAAIFSEKHRSVDEVKKGQIVAIPNDPSNAARALVMLEKLNWITFKEGINLGAASILDIADNVYDLQFRVVLSELIPRMLDEVDFAIMPGGIAWMSKVDAKYAIYYEQLSPNLEILVAVKKQNLDTQWAQVVKKLYQSDEMKQFITEDSDAKGRFIWPQG